MTPEDRNALLNSRGFISAECLLCGRTNPPVAEFSFNEFWVRDKRDWPEYTGGPVHRVCADKRMETTTYGEEETGGMP